MIHLRITQGSRILHEIKSPKRALIIGREKGDLILPDDRVSKVHGEIYLTGRHCVYRDLLSSNGSVIRTHGQAVRLGPLMPEWPLNPGDQIVVGESAIEFCGASPEPAALPDPFTEATEEHTAVNREPESDSQSPASAEVVRFSKLLQVLAYDSTDLRQVKLALCGAFRQVFPNADGVALVAVLPGVKDGLRREHVDSAQTVANPADVPSRFSFQVLRKAFLHGPVLFVNNRSQRFDPTESMQQIGISSCLCAPIARGDVVTAFVQLYTTDRNTKPFTQCDVQLLGLLASVAGLVLHNAQDAEERSLLRALAAVGQIVAGLGHDASSMMRTIGMTADGVERSFPAIAENSSWQLLRRDLEFVGFMARDIKESVHGKGRLQPRRAAISRLADDAWTCCQRFYLSESAADRVRFVNACDPSLDAWVDPLALTRVLVNCIKNSLEALPTTGRGAGHARGTIALVSSLDYEEPEKYLLLHVCDDGTGIPPDVLSRLAGGRGLVSTKVHGSGLGVNIVLDLIGRMHGQVRLASSRKAAGDCPAGTVVSFRLPRCEPSVAADAEAGPRALEIVSDYAQYRSRIEVQVLETPV